MELNEKAVSKKQQRFFGMVRAAQKGEGTASPEVAKVAADISKKDAKDFASTKHKGLPEKKKIDEKFGQWKQAVKDRDKTHRKKSKTKKQKWREGGNEKLKDVNTPAEKQSMQAVGGFRGVHGANRKSKAAQGKPAPVVYSYKKKVEESVMDIVRKYSKKKEEKKPQKATDAGARARRKLQRREYKDKVSSIVPSELEDQKSWVDFRKHFHI